METGMGEQVRKRLRGTERLLEVSSFEIIHLNSTPQPRTDRFGQVLLKPWLI